MRIDMTPTFGILRILAVMTTFIDSGLLAAVPTAMFSTVMLSTAEPQQSTDRKKQAMTFQNLQRVDGKKISIESYQQHYLVVCFTSNTCPYSVDYEQRLKQLQQKFQKEKWSAVVVAINSNDHKDDTLELMAKKAKQQKFNFDYLKDEDQSVATAFDAIYTPEFFVLNQRRQVVYQGALDDATRSEDVTLNYVLKAIESDRDGQVVQVAKTGARGCRIRFQRRRKKQESE